MKHRLSLLILLIAAVLVPRVAAAGEVEPDVAKGRALVATFGSQLQAANPHDRARGYAQGDIRGAFSLTWSTTDADSQ